MDQEEKPDSGLTQIEGVPDSLDVKRKRGMASFPGTGPSDKTCGDCRHRGYVRTSKRKRFDTEHGWHYKRYWFGACAMFRKLAGRHGARISKTYPSCKYFEQRPQKNATAS